VSNKAYDAEFRKAFASALADNGELQSFAEGGPVEDEWEVVDDSTTTLSAKSKAPAADDDEWEPVTPSRAQSRPAASDADEWEPVAPRGQQPPQRVRTPDDARQPGARPAPEGELATIGREGAHGAGGIAGALMGGAGAAALVPGAGWPVAAALAIGGAVAGGAVGAGAQKLVERALGVNDDEQRQVNAEANPISAEIGKIAPQLATGAVGAGAQLAKRGINAAAMGGLTAVEQAYEGEFNPKDIALAAATGFVLPDVNRLGRVFTRPGEKLGAAAAAKINSRVKEVDSGLDPTSDQGEETPTPPPAVKSKGVAASEGPPPDIALEGNTVNPRNREPANEKYLKKVGKKAETIGDIWEEDGLSQSQRTTLALSLQKTSGREDFHILNQKEEPLPLQNQTNKVALQEPPGPADAVQAEASVAEPAPRGPEPEPPRATAEQIAAHNAEIQANIDRAQEMQRRDTPGTQPPVETGLATPWQRELVKWGYPPDMAAQVKNPAIAKKIIDDYKAKNQGKPPEPAEEMRQPIEDFGDRAVEHLEKEPVTEPVTEDLSARAKRVEDQLAAAKAKQAELEATTKTESTSGVQSSEAPEQRARRSKKADMTPGNIDIEGDIPAQIKEHLADPKWGKGVTGRRPLMERVANHPDLSDDTKGHFFNNVHRLSPKAIADLNNTYRQADLRPTTESGKVAKSAEDAARKSEAGRRVQQAYDIAMRESEALTTSPTTLADRHLQTQIAKKAVDSVREHLATYKPAEKDAAYVYMRKAQALLAGKIDHGTFWHETQANKYLSPKDVRETDRIASDTLETQSRPEAGELADLGHGATDITGRAAEHDFGSDNEYGRSELLTPKDLEVKDTNKEIDLLHLDSTEGGREMAQQMQQIIHNLVNEKPPQPGTKKRTKYTEEAEKLVKDKVTEPVTDYETKRVTTKEGKKAPMTVSKAYDKGRHIEVTPEIEAKYGNHLEEGVDPKAVADVREADMSEAARKGVSDATDKVEKPPRKRKKVKPGQVDTETTPVPFENLPAKFLKDEAGGGKVLNTVYLDATWRTKVNKAMKWANDIIGHWTTEPEIKADAILAGMQSSTHRVESWLAHELDARFYRFLKHSTHEDQLNYLHTIEQSKAWDKDGNFNETMFKTELKDAGLSEKQSEWMADEAKFHKQFMDLIWQHERLLGSEADYVENYVSHIFKKEKEAREYMQKFMDEQIKKHGEDWFTKGRSFDLLKQAIDAGFELKYKNPIDIINARARASLKYQHILYSLRELQDMGVATRVQDATKSQKMTWKSELLAADGKRWLIAPEVSNLVKNAITSVGLRDRNDVIGSVYRGWMDVKNTLVPIKLGLSGFHWVHVVLNVNLAANVAREFTRAANLTKGGLNMAEAAERAKTDVSYLNAKPGDASWWEKTKALGTGLGRATKLSAGDTLFSLPFDKFGYQGKTARNAWDTADDNLSPLQRFSNNLIQESGGIPHRNPQELMRDRKLMDELLEEGKYIRAVPAAIQQGVKVSSAFMFEHQIPNLKTASFLRDAQALFERRPDLLNNPVQRKVALRAIMQSVDNRYGEMFYNSLFMNKVLKESSIGAFLSLGWNLGQVREFGGAAANLITGKGRLAAAQDKYKNATAREDVDKYTAAEKGLGISQRTRYEATNKGAYTAAYAAISMASAAALSYALSGVFPSDWKDWFFPRVGGVDPEGQPRRVTTPFNTREPIMLKAHMDSEGVVGGMGAFLWNKMILSPLVDAVKNRDYFGNELFDTNAPWYKAAFQLVDSFLGENLMPITGSGYQRGTAQGGSPLKTALTSVVGLGPAPAYVNRSPLQRRLTQLYNEHVVPHSRPYEDRGPMHAVYNWAVGEEATKNQKIRKAMQDYNQAFQSNDTAAMKQAQKDMIRAGMSPDTALHMRPGDADKRKFARLDVKDQLALSKDMDDADFKKYVLQNPKVHGKNRVELLRLRKSSKPGVALPTGNTDEE